MDVLFVTPVPPLATKPRPHHFLRGLARLGHRVHLLTVASSGRNERSLADDPSWRAVADAAATVTVVRSGRLAPAGRALAATATSRPLRVAYCADPDLRRVAGSLARTCDVAHVDRPRIASLLADLAVPKVLDATDSLTLYLRRVLRHGPPIDRAIAVVELPRMPRYESKMGCGYEACLVTTPADAEALRLRGLSSPLTVLPNGVDERLFSVAREERTANDEELLFVGVMDYAPNVDAMLWFVRSVWPTLRRERPRLVLTIVGANPPRAIRRLERDPRIEVTGWVPDTRPFLARATIAISPVRVGGGFPNKVAEYLAAGVPTVARPEATVGIPDIVPGEHLLHAADAGAFVSRTLELLDGAGRRHELSESGRSLMDERYRWAPIVDRLEDLLMEAAS